MRAVADRRYVVFLMSGIIALAWLTLWLWGHSPYGRWLQHDGLSGAGLGDGLEDLVDRVGGRCRRIGGSQCFCMQRK